MLSVEDDWVVWLTEAGTVVEAWEKARGGALPLSDMDRVDLTDRVARAIKEGFERGRTTAR